MGGWFPVAVAFTTLSGCGLPSSSAQVTQSQPSTAIDVDAGDFYYFAGKPIPLNRALHEVVVGVSDEATAAGLVRDAPVPIRAGDSTVVRGRRFIVMVVEAARPGADSVSQVLAWLRLRQGVWFVSRVFYHPPDGVRMTPTDEIIVRTAANTTSEQLSSVLKAKGLRQISLLDGTTDQYILRIESAKDGDVLRVARELFESGLFQWAEPNFIQQYRKEGEERWG